MLGTSKQVVLVDLRDRSILVASRDDLGRLYVNNGVSEVKAIAPGTYSHNSRMYKEGSDEDVKAHLAKTFNARLLRVAQEIRVTPENVIHYLQVISVLENAVERQNQAVKKGRK